MSMTQAAVRGAWFNVMHALNLQANGPLAALCKSEITFA
jgi:hypothetical protein